MNPITLLVVEDNPTNLKLVTDLLEFEGYRILPAVDAEAALEVVAHTLPDLILMDIALPGMDGLTLTRKFKAAERTRHIPVVALSAFAMKGDAEKAMTAGCAGYITKPIDTRKLPGQVAAFLVPPAPGAQNAPTKVLVVDDTETNRKLLCAMLQAEGLETLQAADGAQALEVLKGQTVDAIISDILMPRMDGFSLCRAVRRSERWRDLPLIFYTASFTSAEDQAFAMKTGADVFLHKPAPIKAILGALHDATRQTASPRPANAESVPESVIMKHFSEHLVCSLEERNSELSLRTAALEREVVERTRAEREARDSLVLADRSRRTLLGVIEDLKTTEATLRTSEERFRQLVENIHEVFWMTDVATNQIIYISPGYEAIWGRTCESLYASSKSWVESIYPEDRERVLQAATTQQTRGGYNETYRIVRPDGTLRWVRDRAFPIRDDAGTAVRVVGVAEDITERKDLEDQFQRVQRLESLGMLAAGIAHDLNNVLAPIGMASSLLRSHVAEAGALRLLDTLEKCADRGAGLVRQILGFARGIGGDARLVQLKHLLRDIAEMITATFPKSIVLDEDVPGDLWPIRANFTQIHQVLLNLCVNARDAMPHGGTLRLGAENCALDAMAAAKIEGGRPGRWVVLHVVDTGTGIPPEVLPRIWDPFFTTKSADQGTGLGLATVRGIVETHRGFITLHTAPQQGTAFRVYLPAVESAESAAAPAGAPSTGRRHDELILLVDDEDLVRETAASILERAGYRVLTAVNGLEAARLFESRAGDIALVVTDHDMPGLDGTALAGLIRALKPAIKIVAASGLDSASRAHRQKHEPYADAFLAKPFTADALLQTVHDLLHPTG